MIGRTLRNRALSWLDYVLWIYDNLMEDFSSVVTSDVPTSAHFLRATDCVRRCGIGPTAGGFYAFAEDVAVFDTKKVDVL